MASRHQIDGVALVTKREGKARLRRSIFEAWADHGCAYCGATADTLDHVRPLARGGVTSRDNLVPACSPCNLRKGHQDALEWFRSHHGWTAEREARLLAWMA